MPPLKQLEQHLTHFEFSQKVTSILVEDENHTGGQEARKGKNKMEPILVALVALVVIAGIIIAGTRFSLYLFLLNVKANQLNAQRRPVAEERMVRENAYGVKHPCITKPCIQAVVARVMPEIA